MNFSKKLDTLMKKNSIKNLRQLASELNIPYTTLWDYYSNPIRLEKANLMYIKKIAQHLNCTIDYLVYDNVLNENEVLIDGYDLEEGADNESKNLITRFKLKFNDNDKEKMNELLKFLNDNIESYKVEQINFNADNDVKYKKLLQDKGLMDEDGNIDEENFNRLMRIADMMKDFNKE